MSKAKVPIWGTTGKALIFDPTAGERALAAVEALRALLARQTGTQYHRDLLELQVGDDHPQYTMWQARETITGQWDFVKPIWASDGSAALPGITWTADTDSGLLRIGSNNFGMSTGGTLRWDINTDRVYQTVNSVIDDVDGWYVRIPTRTYSGIKASVVDGAVDGSSTLFFYETDGNDPANEINGFRFFMDGSPVGNAVFNFYRHDDSPTGARVFFVNRNAQGIDFTERVRGVDGTAALPTYSTTNDPDTGWFATAANNIGVSTGGTERWTFGQIAHVTTLPVRGPNGSAANPTWTFDNSQNAGMYRVAANQVGIATSSTLRWDVSTTRITSTLPAGGPNGTAAAPSWSFSATTTMGMYASGTNTIGWSTSSTLRASLSTTALWLLTDNYELQIGAGAAGVGDLRLLHDGTNSVIRNDTGALRLQGGANIGLEIASSGALSSAQVAAWTATHTFTPASGRAIAANGFTDEYVAVFNGSSTANKSFGVSVRAGTSSSDIAFNVQNQAATRNFLIISGNGNLSFGNTTDNPTIDFSTTNNVNYSGNLRLVQDNKELQLGAGNDLRLLHDGTNSIIRNDTGALRILEGATEVARFDTSAVAGNTRFMVYDVDNGTLERVTVGAADSGGTGYKVLRIPN